MLRLLGLTLSALAVPVLAQPAEWPADATHRALVRVVVPRRDGPVAGPVRVALPGGAVLGAVRAWDLAANREVPAQVDGQTVCLAPHEPLAPGGESRYAVYRVPGEPAVDAVRAVGDGQVETPRYTARLDAARGGLLASLQLKDGNRRVELLGDGYHWWVGRNPQVTQAGCGAVVLERFAAGPVFVGYRLVHPDWLAPGNRLVTEFRFYRERLDIDHHFHLARETVVHGLKMPVSLRAKGDAPGLHATAGQAARPLLTAGAANRWTPGPWHDVSYLGDEPAGLGVVGRTPTAGNLYFMDSVKPAEAEWIYAEPFGWEKPVTVNADFEVALTLVPHPAGPGRERETIAHLPLAAGGSAGPWQARGEPDPDADGDGLTDLAEWTAGTNPTAADTDLDGQLDGRDPAPLTGPAPARRLDLPTRPAEPTTQPQSLARVEPVGGVPTLTIDGEPQGPMCYTRCAEPVNLLGEKGRRGFRVFFEMVGNVGWPDEQEAVFKALDDRLAQVTAQVPDARVILRLYVCAPPQFAKRYPAEVLRFSDGRTDHFTKWYAMQNRPPEERGYPSFASEVWRRNTAVALHRYVTHVRQSAYARHVIGYFVCGGGTEEWYYWGDYDHNRVALDFSPPMLAAFRDHLRRQYGGDVARLRAAWGDPTADFATALPPPPAARNGSGGAFYDPATDQRVRDYYNVHNKAMEDSLLIFARAVKQACDRQQLVGLFHGYLMNHWLLEGGQATLRELLASPDVDFWSGPPQYDRRGSGEHACNRFPGASLRQHGKLWISESDIRTSFSEPAAGNPALYGRPPDLRESLACLQREFAHQLCEGATGWWFPMGAGWYHQPPILDLFERMQRIGRQAMQHDRRTATDVACVVDLDSLFTSPPFAVNSTLLGALNIQETCRLGTPVDHWELADLLAADAPRYKLYLMLNVFSLDDAERRLIDTRLRRDGAVVVWFYAPGYFNPDHAPERAAEHTRALLGFTVQPEPARPVDLAMRLTAAGQKVFPDFAADRVFGLQERPRADPDPATGQIVVRVPAPPKTPQRFVGGEDAEVLARFVDGDQPALLRRVRPQATDYWIGATIAPADLLRSLARQAGCHLYCDADEIVYANRSFLAIHTREAGRRTFRLRRRADVVDAFTGEVVARAATSFEATIPGLETRLYHLGDAAAWASQR